MDHVGQETPTSIVKPGIGARRANGWLLCLTVYVIYLFLFGWAPFRPVEMSMPFFDLYDKKFGGFSGIVELSWWDMWTNILLFVPFGFLVAAVGSFSRRSWGWTICVASLSAAGLSFIVELGQLWLPRQPSFDDVFCNTSGAIVGALLYGGFSTCRCVMRAANMRLPTGVPRIVTFGAYLSILLAVFTIPVPLYFANWDPSYPLQLGNEGTQDRPWRGSLYLVALYDRALTGDEVRTNFSAGPDAGLDRARVTHGLRMLYDFSEGTGRVVHDRVGNDPSANLTIREPDHARWLAPHGLTLRHGTIVASDTAPAKLADDRFVPGRGLSVEAWLASPDLAQSGPARIVSYSLDTTHRNFTLAQQQGDIAFRVRTPVSGPNGTQPELITSGQPLTGAVQHVVATFQSGIERLYVDGAEHGQAALQTKIGLIDVAVSLLGAEFRGPMWSALMFPVGILASRVSQGAARFKQPAWMPWGSALGAALVISGTRAATLTPSEPLSFVMVAAGSAIASVLIAQPFHTMRSNAV